MPQNAPRHHVSVGYPINTFNLHITNTQSKLLSSRLSLPLHPRHLNWSGAAPWNFDRSDSRILGSIDGPQRQQ
jgi:hypothetical protein